MSSFTRGAKVQRKQPNTTPTGEQTPSHDGHNDNIAQPTTAVSTVTTIVQSTPAQIQSVTTTAPPASSPISSIRPSGAGCRSWIHGLTLTSTGVSGIDSILGGGATLGSILCLKDDTPFDSACTPVLAPFLTSFIADGIGFGHRTLIVTPHSHSGAEAFIRTLPRNTTIERRQQDAKDEEQILKDSAKAQEQHDLKIAWRYAHLEPAMGATQTKPKQSLSTPSAARSVSSATLSASYDYHANITSQLLQTNPPQVISIQDDILPLLPPSSAACSEAQRTALIYRHTLERISSFLASSPPGGVSRLFLQSYGSYGWSTSCESQARPMQVFLGHLRQMLASQGGTIAMLSIESSLMPAPLIRSVTHYGDIIISVSGFSASAAVSAKVLGDYDGLLRLERATSRHSLLSSSGAADESSGSSTSAASGNCFLYKLTRRKVIVEKFALPPDADDDEDDVAGSQSSLPTSHVPTVTTRGSAPVRAREKKIEYEPTIDESTEATVLGANLARHNTTPKESTSRREKDAPLHAILQGRSSVTHAAGCSNSHQLPGHKMDF